MQCVNFRKAPCSLYTYNMQYIIIYVFKFQSEGNNHAILKKQKKKGNKNKITTARYHKLANEIE